MARLLAVLLRHGEYRQLPGAPSAHQPFGLNQLGRQQAVEGADRLVRLLDSHDDWLLDAEVHSSNLLRAWETASLLVEHLPGAERVVCYEALAERSVGCAANLTLQQIEQVLDDDPRYERPPPGWKSDRHYRLPLSGAESLMEAGLRVARHIDDSLQSCNTPADETLVKLFVGHGAAFRHAAHHLGVLRGEEIARLSMHHVTPVVLERLDNFSYRQVAGEWKQRHADDNPD